ncbi:MAG TPA: UDP-N-acetylmuramoyl-tripeptide--D-alanyl-D-alanine ligase [Oscillospiraceae bacterium]|nr:UDP-N-acetylmuramoyl-tripeptide--D-alanyl-D-alanine ligase [Oscillospiraceae bacterium]
MEINCKTIAALVQGKIVTEANQEAEVKRVVIDSRGVQAGDFFVPFAGEHTDGHRFIAQAADSGAVGCFVDQTAELTPPSELCAIAVPETLIALQQLAHGYRLQYTLPIVAVTGSVGKTTTKDLIAAALSGRYQVLKTEGNLNNQIGLPIMLTRLTSKTEVAVLEMGMSGLGEIAALAQLAVPSIGVITNIGESHLEMLGSREGIAQAKCELLQSLPADGVAVVNADEPLLEPYWRELACPVITFGFSRKAVIRPAAGKTGGKAKKVQIEQAGYPPLVVTPPLPGRHNIYNLLAAVAVGRALELTNAEIEAGLAQLQLSGMRLEITTLPVGYTVINDAYNASPTSVAAALNVLREEAGEHGKIAVLGDMLELGALEEEGHRQVGRLAAASRLKGLVVLGPRSPWIAAGAQEAGMAAEMIVQCTTHVQAAEAVELLAQAGDWLLLKGSRGMQMEEVLKLLQRVEA